MDPRASDVVRCPFRCVIDVLRGQSCRSLQQKREEEEEKVIVFTRIVTLHVGERQCMGSVSLFLFHCVSLLSSSHCLSAHSLCMSLFRLPLFPSCFVLHNAQDSVTSVG